MKYREGLDNEWHPSDLYDTYFPYVRCNMGLMTPEGAVNGGEPMVFSYNGWYQSDLLVYQNLDLNTIALIDSARRGENGPFAEGGASYPYNMEVEYLLDIERSN